jgi:hypothetical protein
MKRLVLAFACSICLAVVFSGCGSGTLGGGANAGAGTGGRVGTGGRGGVGNSEGIGGVGASAGMTGEGPCFDLPYDNTRCLDGLCGNGVVDVCTTRAAVGPCPELKATEICDGADVGGATCVDRGYGSGTLVCDNRCAGVDTSGCKECGALDASLLRCGDAPIAVSPPMAVMAATDTEVALAWLELDSAGELVLAFARLSPNLDLLSVSRVADASPVIGGNLQIAALPTGWVVAGLSESDVVVQAFDADGLPLARTTVDTLSAGVYPNALMLAARPSAGPLLLWMLNDEMRVAMVAADGRSATAPTTLTTDDISGALYGVAWVGDAFYVAMTLERGNNPDQLHLKRVDSTGKLVAAFDALPGVSVWDASLVTGAQDLRVVYTGEVGAPIGGQRPRSVVWQRLDATGNPVGDAISLGSAAEYQWGRGVAFGTDTGLLVEGFGDPLTMASARLASDGRTVASPHTIARGEPLGRGWIIGTVRRGPDLIVAWMLYPYPPRPIQLARIAL